MPNLPTIKTSVISATLVVFLFGELGLSFVPRLNHFVCKGDFKFVVLVNASRLSKALRGGSTIFRLRQFFESEKPLLPLLLKLPLLPLVFLKPRVNVAPFPLRSPLLLLLVRRVTAEVERHKDFLAASLCKTIMDKYLPVC